MYPHGVGTGVDNDATPRSKGVQAGRAAGLAASLLLALGAVPGITQVQTAPAPQVAPVPALLAPGAAGEGSVTSLPKPLSAAEAPRYMRQLARQLRAVIRNTPVELVTARDDLLKLRIPVEYLFALDATQLRTEGPLRLDPLVMTLLKSDRTTVGVVGHSDSLATREFNAAFTLQRATAVTDYLQRQGVAAARVGARGAGEMERVEKKDDSPEARRRNRRIELEVRPSRPSRREAS